MVLAIIHPPAVPKKVENKSPTSTFDQPSQRRAEGPPAARPATESTAIRACDSLVGIPYRQAITLQNIIAVMAAATVVRLRALVLIMPLPIVEATAVPAKAPAVFNNVAKITACLGVRVLVETTVAMALGASVHPFTNSAARIRKRTKTSSSCSIFSP